MHKEKKVILVEDDRDFRLQICNFLVTKGFFVYATETIEEFKELLDKYSPDIALIDKNLEFESGFDLASHIRKHETLSNIPIIVITGDSELDSRMEAFKLGADDFLAKPIILDELELRVRANLRRSGSYEVEEQMIRYGDVHINLRSQEIYLNDEKIPLTNIEYKILLELVSKKNEVLQRERLASKVLSFNNSNVRTLDVHINSLRKKLGSKSSNLKTIRGKGYVYRTSDK